MAKATTKENNGNTIINPGLRADIMRQEIETKDTLTDIGSIYVGTGTTKSITGTDITISNTKALKISDTPSTTGSNEHHNKVLMVGADGQLGYAKITGDNIANDSALKVNALTVDTSATVGDRTGKISGTSGGGLVVTTPVGGNWNIELTNVATGSNKEASICYNAYNSTDGKKSWVVGEGCGGKEDTFVWWYRNANGDGSALMTLDSLNGLSVDYVNGRLGKYGAHSINGASDREIPALWRALASEMSYEKSMSSGSINFGFENEGLVTRTASIMSHNAHSIKFKISSSNRSLEVDDTEMQKIGLYWDGDEKCYNSMGLYFLKFYIYHSYNAHSTAVFMDIITDKGATTIATYGASPYMPSLTVKATTTTEYMYYTIKKQQPD